MTPIINPWLFYTAEISFKLSFILIILMAIFGFIFLFFFLDEITEEKNENEGKAKFIFKIFLITLIAFTFLPSKKTCYKMMISAQITEENVDKAEDIIQKSIDYISEKINKE